MPQTSSRLDSIKRIIVPVEDPGRALGFYTESLGFDTIIDVPFGDGDRWIEVSPPGGGTAIAFGPAIPGRPVGVPTGISFSTDDIDALHADLVARGVDVDAEVRRDDDGSPPMFWFRDADGNTLHVAAA